MWLCGNEEIVMLSRLPPINIAIQERPDGLSGDGETAAQQMRRTQWIMVAVGNEHDRPAIGINVVLYDGCSMLNERVHTASLHINGRNIRGMTTIVPEECNVCAGAKPSNVLNQMIDVRSGARKEPRDEPRRGHFGKRTCRAAEQINPTPVSFDVSALKDNYVLGFVWRKQDGTAAIEVQNSGCLYRVRYRKDLFWSLRTNQADQEEEANDRPR
jgi:hypothetical protein